jgi:hypothetical protein
MGDALAARMHVPRIPGPLNPITALSAGGSGTNGRNGLERYSVRLKEARAGLFRDLVNE